MPEQMTKQDAIETLEIFRNDYTREGSGMCQAIDIAIDALRQSTIEAEPVRHGQWIELPKALNADENPCKCSVCGHCLSFYNHYPKSKFCPNCGARMEVQK